MDENQGTPDLIQRVAAFLEEKTKDRELACPVCGSQSWTVGGITVQVLQFKEGGASLLLGGPVYPLAALFCATCGYARFFNLVLMGLLPSGAIPVEAHPPVETNE